MTVANAALADRSELSLGTGSPRPSSGVFLSAVSSEFEKVRTELASRLRRLGIDEVKVQDDFVQSRTALQLLQRLEEYIRDECETVVCIVGLRSGAPPTDGEVQAAVADLLAHPRDRLPESYRNVLEALILRGFAPRASYTQWELIFALKHGRNLLLFATESDYPAERDAPPTDDPGLQEDYRRLLFDDLGLYRSQVSTGDRLLLEVLSQEWWPNVHTGARRQGTPTPDGDENEEARVPPHIRPKKLPAKDALPDHHLPANDLALVGRDKKVDDVLGLLVPGERDRRPRLVALRGDGGVGKRAVLQEVAHRPELLEIEGFEHGKGVWPGPILGENPDDFRQRIWEEFYVAEPNPDHPDRPIYPVDPDRRAKDLRGIEALLFLTDADSVAPELQSFVSDEMPESAFYVSVREESARELPSAKRVPLEGLTPAEAVALFAAQYDSDVPPEADEDIGWLCDQGVLGNPGLIQVLAADASENARPRRRGGGEHPLIAWAAAARQRAEGTLDDHLDAPELHQAIAAVNAAGVYVPESVLLDLVGPEEAIQRLVDAGILQRNSPRYRLNPALTDPRAARVAGIAVEGSSATSSEDEHPTATADADTTADLFQRTVVWARTASLAEIYDERAFVVRMIEWGVADAKRLATSGDAVGRALADRRRGEVIELGESTEAAMAAGARHGAWESVLVATAQAARDRLAVLGPDDASADGESRGHDDTVVSTRESLGRALHQLGSRALLRDELRAARVFLCESLAHRTSPAARRLTARNLRLIPAAVIPYAVLVAAPVLGAAAAVAAFVDFPEPDAGPADTGPAIVEISPDVHDFSDDPDGVHDFTVTHLRGGAIPIDSITAPDGFTWEGVGSNPCEPGRELDQRQENRECTIRVEWDGEPATGFLEIEFPSRGRVSREGDERALLIGVPER